MNDTQIEMPMALHPAARWKLTRRPPVRPRLRFEGRWPHCRRASTRHARRRTPAVRAMTVPECALHWPRMLPATSRQTVQPRCPARLGRLKAALPGPAADLELPALSRYQKRAALEEAALDVHAFETGMGADARAYLNFLAGETMVLAAAKDTQERATVRVEAEAGAAAAAGIDVVAAPGSTFDLVVALDAPAAMGAGVEGACRPLRVFAGSDARVNVTPSTP